MMAGTAAHESPATRARRAWNRRWSRYWFVSFPKSGRTWTMAVVARYLASLHGTQPFVYQDLLPWIRLGARSRVPRIHFVHPHCRDVDPAATRRLQSRLSRARVILLVRDPRETVLTYAARLRKRRRDPLALSLDTAGFIRNDELGIGRVIDFTNLWWSCGDVVGDLLALRFEDLRDEPLRWFPRLLAYLDQPVREDLLRDALARTPDTTTTAIRAGDPPPDASDLAYMAERMRDLDPAVGYHVDGPPPADGSRAGRL